MHGNIPYLFDFWPDPVVHRLLLNYTTRKYKCMGVQPSGTLYMFTKLIYFFHSVNPCHHIWVAKDRKLH